MTTKEQKALSSILDRIASDVSKMTDEKAMVKLYREFQTVDKWLRGDIERTITAPFKERSKELDDALQAYETLIAGTHPDYRNADDVRKHIENMFNEIMSREGGLV